jgi:predicted transcriptional regulator YdeE
MENVSIKEVNIVGISIRTTNENSQAAKDIPELWNKFMTEGILEQIPNKIDHSIYSIYTKYQSDHNEPYTAILGCKVSSVENIPDGMIAQTIQSGNYTKFVAKGNLNAGVVYEEWLKIWDSKLNRKYTTDFEIYGEKAQNPNDAEVEIFIASK